MGSGVIVMDEVVTIGGARYIFRLSVKSLHLIEKSLGEPFQKITESLSLEDCITVSRYALRHIDSGDMLTDAEFDALIDSVDVSELVNMFPKANEPGKN